MPFFNTLFGLDNDLKKYTGNSRIFLTVGEKL